MNHFLSSSSNNPKELERFNQYQRAVQVNNTYMFAGKLLYRAYKQFAHNIAIIFKDETITYAQLYERSAAVSKYLCDMGVRPRDRVAIWIENAPEFYVAYYGAWQMGAVVVPLNTFLHVQEFSHIIQDAAPTALIISDALYSKLADHTILESVLIIKTSELPAPLSPGDTVPLYDLDPDELAALLYTSGTTGMPKGVMLSSKNILTNLCQGLATLNVHEHDRLLGVLPLFHSFAQLACVWGVVLIGGTVILVPKIDRRLLTDALCHKPTFILGVPALYGLFCLMKHARFDAVRYFISGGDALPDKIRCAFSLIYQRKICNGFGLTEASPLVAVNFQDELLPAEVVGRLVIGLSGSLRDEDGNVTDDEVGVLWIKGDNIMLGYYHDEKQTNMVLKDGWLNTGDFASCDHQGRIVIRGRQKDLIIHKGFNIYPQEIENVLMSHPLVFKAGVIGFYDPDVGDIPIAFVAVKNHTDSLEKDLKMLCLQNLAAYKLPKKFICLSDLPMTALAKVDKKNLRKTYKDTI